MSGEHVGSKTSSVGEYSEVLTTEELAQRLRVPPSWIREQTRSRNLQRDPLPHLRFGRYVRFDWTSTELQSWVKRRIYRRSLNTSNPIC